MRAWLYLFLLALSALLFVRNMKELQQRKPLLTGTTEPLIIKVVMLNGRRRMPIKKPWRVYCDVHGIEEGFSNQSDASRFWVNHNKTRHGGKLIAILSRNWG